MEIAYSAGSKRLVQVIAALGSSIAPFMVASLIVATPAIGEEFSADVSLLGWVTAAFFLSAAAFLVPFGRVADIRGARKVFTAGIAVYLLSALLSGTAPSIQVLIAGRVLTGIGAAMVFGTSIAVLSLVFPLDERGKAFGINVTAMFVGFLAGLLAGGGLTYYAGWRSIFVVVIGIAALDLVLILSRVKRECELARVKEYDPLGMVLYTPGILLTIFGMSEIEGFMGLPSLITGILLIATFLWWEHRAPNPLLPLMIRENRLFLLAGLTNVLFQASAFAPAFLLSLYFQYVAGLDPRLAGLLLIVPQVFVIFLTPLSGRFSDQIPPLYVAGAGCTMNGIAVLLLISLGESTPLTLLIITLALNGAGNALFMPAVLAWVIRLIPRESYGVASGITETARLAGITVGNAVIIIVFSLVMGDAPVSTALIPQFLLAARIAFLAYTLLAIAATVIALRGGRG